MDNVTDARNATGGGIQNYDISSEGEINSFYFYETEQFMLLWLMFTAIVFGNTSVLVTLLFSKSRKSRMNFFIMQLAFADLLVGLISVLTDIIWHITVSWTAGNAACKVIRFLQAVVTYSSTFVLVALSVDRFDAITHPMNFSGSWRRARILVATSWLLSIVFSTPSIVLYEEKVIQGRLQCWIELSKTQWKVYMTIVAILLFLIPAFIITACYTIIVYTIWTKSKILTPAHYSSTPLKNGDRYEEGEIRRASSRGIIPRAKIKTVKMTFVIVFVFILCWSPYIVFDLLQVYGYIPQTQTNIAIANFIQSLAPLNSAANPVIYCLFSTHLCRPLRLPSAIEFGDGETDYCKIGRSRNSEVITFRSRTDQIFGATSEGYMTCVADLVKVVQRLMMKVPVLGWLCCGSVYPTGDSTTLTDTAASSQRNAACVRRLNTVQLRPVTRTSQSDLL